MVVERKLASEVGIHGPSISEKRCIFVIDLYTQRPIVNATVTGKMSMLLRGRLEETPGASFTVEATTSESQTYFSRFNFEVYGPALYWPESED